MKKMPHKTKIQIRFSDIDKIGHVNNAVFLQYMETARVQYFNDAFGNKHNWDKKGFVVARNEINYLLPLYLNDEIYCSTRCVKIGNKSLTLENVIYRNKNGKIEKVADGIGILVAMDYQKKKSIALPPSWIKKIRNFENNSD